MNFTQIFSGELGKLEQLGFEDRRILAWLRTIVLSLNRCGQHHKETYQCDRKARWKSHSLYSLTLLS